uniref:Opsin n=1 Tax=Ditylenchus dipsaci TaxID=166011 RepID=A0A915CNI7_9BILA
MELYFLRPSVYEKLYNCNIYSIDQVPIESRQHVIAGTIFMVLATIFIILYIPCLVALGKRLEQSCYKFLFFIGIVDVICLPICGLTTGYMAINGAVFCSYPTFFFFAGNFWFCWVTESSTAVILALSRCFEVISPNLSRQLFHGKKTWVWIAMTFLYGLCFVTFTKTSKFSSIEVAWFFNPHFGYIDDLNHKYANQWQTCHNIVICLAICILYILFIVIFVVKNSITNMPTIKAKNMSLAQKMFKLYIFTLGMPSVFFLTMNKTIRQDCLHMLFDLVKNKRVSSVKAIVVATDNSKSQNAMTYIRKR